LNVVENEVLINLEFVNEISAGRGRAGSIKPNVYLTTLFPITGPRLVTQKLGD